ncbi:MAG: YCF48-related protein [Gemmatales bacterium]|nr:YCF48-related protein [Gemmatales bacterium]MDW7994638.1 YCF48-related protein [Gemmatales bacterium]
MPRASAGMLVSVLFMVGAMALHVDREARCTRVKEAALRALWFVDEHEGWAVGDDGLILHTIDGGQTWERQPSGTRAHLRAVQFLSPFVGYVVGEQPLPETPLTVGVLLMTRDGGATWRVVSDNQLPGLYGVRFFDERQGVLVGDTNDAFPSGLWTTEDGGLTWRMVPNGRQPGWYAAAWRTPRHGFLAGRWGKLATWTEQTWQPVVGDWTANLAIRAIQWNGKTAWACGDAGLLLRCDDPQGRKWERVSLPIDSELLRLWDFHAMHFLGDFGWIAGRPGSVILHTWDNGQTWQVQATPQTLPIHALYFVNERCGWAAGDGGTILHTQDGGKTWRIQHRGAHRAAVLFITARGESLPWELLTNLAWDQGFYTVAVRVLGEDAETFPEDSAGFADRFHAAVRCLGGLVGETLHGWTIPSYAQFTSTVQLAERLGRGQAVHALEQLQRQLVLTLRLWKPDVVITDHPDPRGLGRAEGALVALAVGKAFRWADNADVCSEQISRLRLEPWSASKLYAVWDRAEPDTVSADWDVVRPTVGGTIAQATWSARHLLNPMLRLSPCSPKASSVGTGHYFRLLDSRIPDAATHRWIMDGIHAPTGGPTRRDLASQTPEDDALSEIARHAKKTRDLLALADRMLSTPTIAEQWLAELPHELKTLPEARQADLLWHVSQRLIASGEWGLAHRVLIMLLEQHPDSPLAPAAAQWLCSFLSSSEARRRAELGQFVANIQAPKEETKNQLAPATPRKPAEKANRHDLAPTLLHAHRQDWQFWDRGSVLAGDVLAAMHPLWWREPRVQYPVLVAQRRLGRLEELLPIYTRFRTNWLRGPWYEAAVAEIAFLAPVRGSAPVTEPDNPGQLPSAPRKRSLLCGYTQQPPYLDGRLDDPVWQAATVTRLRNALNQTTDAFPTDIRLAFDQCFLYIALHCGHPAGHQREPVRPRKRDDDLHAYDRISILLDLDRDYVTYFHFQVDQRGCVHDECWGDSTWNPQWYVASRSTPTAWEAELAIPWAELVREPPNSQQVWAINFVRIIPNHGVQALSLPAGVCPRPEGMGLLTFANSK